MRRLTLDISIPAERYEALYSGSVRDVQAMSREGLRVRFPGRILQKFLNHDGVCGTFVIEFDDSHKFRAITKIV
jgi:hypothetical protein